MSNFLYFTLITPFWSLGIIFLRVFINLIPVLPELLYAGVFSVGIAYTLQIVAQVKANTTVAAFILSLESVFAALSGWILIGQNLTFYSILGCSLIFLSVLIADILKINFLKWNLKL